MHVNTYDAKLTSPSLKYPPDICIYFHKHILINYAEAAGAGDCELCSFWKLAIQNPPLTPPKRASLMAQEYTPYSLTHGEFPQGGGDSVQIYPKTNQKNPSLNYRANRALARYAAPPATPPQPPTPRLGVPNK